MREFVKSILLFSLSIMISGCITPPNIKAKIQVLNAQTNQPVIGAEIVVSNFCTVDREQQYCGSVTLTTNTNGEIPLGTEKIANVGKGFKITISKTGYITLSNIEVPLVYLSDNATVDLGVFHLQPESIEGVDNNNNDVRDDVEKAIKENYTDPNIQKALMQTSKVFEDLFARNHSIGHDKRREYHEALNCLVKTADNASQLLSFLKIHLINTDERRIAWFDMERKLSRPDTTYQYVDSTSVCN